MNRDLSSSILKEITKLEEEENLYVSTGRYCLQRKDQYGATYFFTKANQAFLKREQLVARLTIILASVGVNIP